MSNFWNKLLNKLTNIFRKERDMQTITINNVNDVIYDKRNCKYYYKEGSKKHVLNPHGMIIRGCWKNPNAPVVYLNSNDEQMRNGTNGIHPVRRWYSDAVGERYSNAREITVGRWFTLSEERKRFALR